MLAIESRKGGIHAYILKSMRRRRRSNHSLGLKSQVAISIVHTIIHLLPPYTLLVLRIILVNADFHILPYLKRNLFMRACPVR